jgi:hypothetical protein
MVGQSIVVSIHGVSAKGRRPLFVLVLAVVSPPVGASPQDGVFSLRGEKPRRSGAHAIEDKGQTYLRENPGAN